MMFLNDLVEKNGHKIVHFDKCKIGHIYETVFNYSERHGGTVDSFKYYNDYIIDITQII